MLVVWLKVYLNYWTEGRTNERAISELFQSWNNRYCVEGGVGAKLSKHDAGRGKWVVSQNKLHNVLPINVWKQTLFFLSCVLS